MNRERLERILVEHEGQRLERYDIDGVPHIGIGHNIIGRDLSDETLEFLGVEDENDLQVLTDEQCSYLFQKDLDVVLNDCAHFFPDFDELSDVRQEVIVMMLFNLGMVRFARFKQLIAAIYDKNWNKAAAEIMDSKAARLLPERYQQLANAMQDNRWENYETEKEKPTLDLSDVSTLALVEELKQRLQNDKLISYEEVS